MQLREAQPQFEARGANQITVSGKSASMAKTLQPTVPFPLLLDQGDTLRSLLDIDRLSWLQAGSMTSAKNYAKALGSIRNFAAHPSDANQTPAIVILDADQNVAWQHVGKALGDYPSIDDIVAQLPTE